MTEDIYSSRILKLCNMHECRSLHLHEKLVQGHLYNKLIVYSTQYFFCNFTDYTSAGINSSQDHVIMTGDNALEISASTN